MSLLRAQGFRAIATADLPLRYSVNGGQITVETSGGRFGDACLRCGGGGNNISENLDAPITAFVENFWFFIEDALGDDHLVQLWDGRDFVGGTLLTLHVNSDGSIAIRRGLTTHGYLVTIGEEVWTSDPNVIRLGTWTSVEWKGTIHASAGTISLKVNGATLCALTGIRTTGDNSPSGTNQISQVTIGCHAHAIRYTDWLVMDQSGSEMNDFVGNMVAEDQKCLTGNGHYAEFSPSTGSDHGALVRESPIDSTTFNEATTVGQRDTYKWPATSLLESVSAVQVTQFLKKTASGPRAVKLLTRSGGGDYLEAVERFLGEGAYAPYVTVRETDPATGVAWTLVNAAAAEDGPQVTT